MINPADLSATCYEGATVVEFRQPDKLMSMNDRPHWRTRARSTKLWRGTTQLAAQQLRPARARVHGPSIVEVTLPVVDRRRRDPHNYYPTVKAIVDGLVDAGYWPDDTPDHVRTIEPILHVTKTRAVTIRITPHNTERSSL